MLLRVAAFVVGAFLVKNGVRYALDFQVCREEQGFLEACIGAPLLVVAFSRPA